MPIARTVRTLVLAAWISGALTARAAAQGCEPPLGCPDGGNSSAPVILMLVGHDGNGTPDPAGTFTVVLRDLAYNPLSGALVHVELLASDVMFCADQQGAFTRHAATFVEGLTDAAGRFVAAIRGSGSGSAQQAEGGPPGFRIYGNGQLVGSGEAVAFDLDGSGGVGGNDLSIWLAEFVGPIRYLRGDYDASGSVGANDLSIWLTLYGSAGSIASCGP